MIDGKDDLCEMLRIYLSLKYSQKAYSLSNISYIGTHTDRMKKCTIFSHFTPIILHKRIQVYFQLDDVMFRARLMEFSSDNL